MDKDMCCGRGHSKYSWVKRAIFIPIAVVGGIFVFGTLVMCLWNAIIPAVFGLGVITFWQAIGIFVLSKILFGGFHHGRHRHHGHRHGKDMREKWMHLSPEEQEKMRQEWRERCDTEKKSE